MSDWKRRPSIHPSTQDHFLAMMGLKKPKVQTTLPINHNDGKEEFPTEAKDHENNHRAPYKTKIENAVERKCLTKSTIESFYDCDRDHDCASNHLHQINSIEGLITPASTRYPARIDKPGSRRVDHRARAVEYKSGNHRRDTKYTNIETTGSLKWAHECIKRQIDSRPNQEKNPPHQITV